MTRLELMSRLCIIEEELDRLTLAIDEALRPVRADVLLVALARVCGRLIEVIEALPHLEDTPRPKTPSHMRSRLDALSQ